MAKEMSAGVKSAPIAYWVSSRSPLLSAQQKSAISKDFNGAPLSAAPATHVVTAISVVCRVPQALTDTASRCWIAYADAKAATLNDSKALALYNALGAAGVADEPGMGFVERIATALSCTVDDRIAQETPSSGEDIAGFACQFTTR